MKKIKFSRKEKDTVLEEEIPDPLEYPLYAEEGQEGHEDEEHGKEAPYNN